MEVKWITYQWSLAHALMMLFLTGFSFLAGNIQWVCFGALISFFVYTVLNTQVFKVLQPLGGYANWITFFRMGLLLYVGFQFKNLSHLAICSIFIINILFDIADGIVARKCQTESNFGLYLDMELDAFYVCIAALILYFEGLVGVWIIIVGLLRYLYTFIFILLDVELISEPKQKFASLVAGSLFWCLLLPFFNPQLNIVLGLFSALMVLSFVKSFLYQISRT